jgi:hypothetical protein
LRAISGVHLRLQSKNVFSSVAVSKSSRFHDDVGDLCIWLMYINVTKTLQKVK